ncbi:maltose acetyltransferase domain-containing protein [Hirsutella rhossiliensis]|uniref:Maltose acetyltransferase domain-containing protein n=1 Tax=Hirsutella rhossiliensis TaxID=111463 RepID=A0A9P8SNP5_9HYPO|nr:maltose acetyltransferase domain-containing protein [Hirsutella rhossiliensis]KAH0967371.1 maltose acetyltransferase domain-containing protein [Hirsutella rhossiliensis]
MAKAEKDPATIAFAKTLSNVPWCDDYEKMVSGVLYDCLAPELVNGRFRARRLMHKYNSHFPDDATAESLAADREKMLKQMLGKVGKAPFIEPPLNIDYGCNITIGESFYSNFNLVILDCGMVKIGHRVMFGPFVSIFAATHETDVQSRRDIIEYAGNVTIGDDCWIGGNTTIMPGVTIGKGCTIGAGSVVTRSIPDFSVAIGSPAKVVKSVERVPDLAPSSE